MLWGYWLLQGAFREHIKAINKSGAIAFEIRWPEQLDKADGLIIPGGESTTIHKLLYRYGFKQKLDGFYQEGKPIFGTCAGMIIVARKSLDDEVFGLNYIDIAVKRNAYGRQIESFEHYVDIDFGQPSVSKKFKAIFIRAPRILEAGPSVKVLAKNGDDIIMARKNNVLVSSFHPELGSDNRVHEYFVDMVKKSKGEA
ncbi:MAG: pyridoxal 5'-phosphate synthase glutaminase subunit PdxT [Actinomycetota bacterium]|nr:pyridoxal 5'-phosphate synthase glutaminase subunit PdxT [Actinomycetota bacterium]